MTQREAELFLCHSFSLRRRRRRRRRCRCPVSVPCWEVAVYMFIKVRYDADASSVIGNQGLSRPERTGWAVRCRVAYESLRFYGDPSFFPSLQALRYVTLRCVAMRCVAREFRAIPGS